MIRVLTAIALLLGLAACDDDEGALRVGAKNFGESRVLAEMMVALAEEQGVPVEGVVDFATTQAVLEALKRGDIDAYPEYNGTGLVMLGQNPTPDGDEATARVKELYEPLGLTWLGRFGFANNYGIVMRAEQAKEMGITTISDLVVRAPRLTLAIESDFQNRPLDGLQPLLARYAMEFEEIEVVPLDERGRIYDMLIDGRADVIEGYTTDGQIADYGLVILEDDLGFFPVYQASPLVSGAALSEFPGLGPALETLAGKIDADLMQELNRRVDIEGRSARAVARDALARLELIEAGAVQASDPLIVATDAAFVDGQIGAATLRAARRAFTGREVQLLAAGDPLAAVGADEARLALVGADAFFDISTPAPTRTASYEAIAAMGEAVIHVIGARDGTGSLGEAAKIAVGPDGSSSARIGATLIAGLELEAELVTVEEGSVEALAAAVKDGEADLAIVIAAAGDADIVSAFETGGLSVVELADWGEGANLVRFPYLREGRLAARTYPGQFNAVDTLRMQLVLAGPAPQTGDLVGDAGPSSIAVAASPLADSTVRAINAAVPGNLLVDPVLPMAGALRPELPPAPASMNPSPDISILSVALVVFLVWLCWLYVRPDYR